MVTDLYQLFFNIVFIAIPIAMFILVEKLYKIRLSLVRLCLVSIYCVFIYILNKHFYYVYSHGSQVSYYSDFMILLLYFNLTLLLPVKMTLRAISYIKVIVITQALFILMYFYDLIITYYFFSTAPYHLGNYYWLDQLIEDIKTIPNII